MILVIDSGTTNTKALLFDAAGGQARETRAATRTLHPGPERVEQKAEDWWSAAKTAIGKLPSGERNRVRAIVTSTQGGTFAPLDRTGKPLRPGITWLDNRASGEAATLNLRSGKDFFHRRTGHNLLGWCPPAIIAHLRKHEPSVHQKTARLTFVADYLNYRLSGRFFLDQSAAGMTVLFNVDAGLWDREILRAAGIKEESLPDIVPAGECGGYLAGPAARTLGLPEGIPVISGGHDQYCASLGVGAVKPGDCLLSCGTAWALLVRTETPLYEFSPHWSPGRHVLGNAFGLMAAIGDGGIVLDWIRRNFVSAEEGRRPAARAEPAVRVLSEFSRGKGGIVNLSLASGGREVLLAGRYALTRQAAGYLEELKSSIRVKRIILVGGGAEEPLVPILRAGNPGCRIVVRSAVKEAASRGAALLALDYLKRTK